MNKLYGFAFLLLLTACSNQLEQQFKNPPNQYKPMPFWHINGELTTEGIRQQVKDANDAGFAGITLIAAGRKESNKARHFAKVFIG
jgi:hypothetical protein